VHIYMYVCIYVDMKVVLWMREKDTYCMSRVCTIFRNAGCFGWGGWWYDLIMTTVEGKEKNRCKGERKYSKLSCSL